jgi:hypothetical protein
MEAPSGIEALLQVSREDADVAVAWEDVKLKDASREVCAALCNYVSYDLDGIFIERVDKPIKTRIDLRKIKFGFRVWRTHVRRGRQRRLPGLLPWRWRWASAALPSPRYCP